MLHEKFLEYARTVKKRSPHTIKAYRSDIDSLLSMFPNKKIQNISSKNILEWQTAMAGTISDNSLRRAINAIRSMYKFLIRFDYVTSSPMDSIELPKKVKPLAETFSHEEMDKVFDLAFEEGFRGQRDRMMLEVLYATGMRVSELVNLRFEDVRLHDNEIQVNGKGSKQRQLYISDRLSEELAQYISLVKLEFRMNDYLFPTNKGQQGYQLFVQRIMKKYFEQVTDANVFPHKMRHTVASHLMNNGCNLRDIQELLGHEDIGATQIYTHLDMRNKKKLVGMHPRG